jgi:hypothetical protein
LEPLGLREPTSFEEDVICIKSAICWRSDIGVTGGARLPPPEPLGRTDEGILWCYTWKDTKHFRHNLKMRRRFGDEKATHGRRFRADAFAKRPIVGRYLRGRIFDMVRLRFYIQKYLHPQFTSQFSCKLYNRHHVHQIGGANFKEITNKPFFLLQIDTQLK